MMEFEENSGVFQALRFLVMLTNVIVYINAGTIAEMETLHTSLFSGYNKNVRPRIDQNSVVDVKIFMFIKSIREFDEVDEKFSFIAALQLHWIDEKLRWDKSLNGGIEQLTVSYDDVWVPELTLSNPSSKGTTIGKSSDRIRVNYLGEVEWMPASLIESTCSVNARNFPFDIQSCDTSFFSLGYKSNEVNLIAGSHNVLLIVYSPHALWSITESEVTTWLFGSDSESEITFTINLRRDATFVVINVLIPISILSLLNVLAFLLVPESGERIGYCITTLLAIAVYMTIVNDLLPKTSQPVPLICYKLIVDLLISALMVFVTIVNMRLYSKSDNDSVPNWLKSLYRLLTCTGGKIHPGDTGDDILNRANERNEIQEHTSKQKSNENYPVHENSDQEGDLITWKKISYMNDWIALFTSISMSVMNMAIFVGLATS